MSSFVAISCPLVLKSKTACGSEEAVNTHYVKHHVEFDAVSQHSYTFQFIILLIYILYNMFVLV